MEPLSSLGAQVGLAWAALLRLVLPGSLDFTSDSRAIHPPALLELLLEPEIRPVYTTLLNLSEVLLEAPKPKIQ